MWGLYLKFLKLILLNLSCTRNSLNATKWIKEIAFLLDDDPQGTEKLVERGAIAKVLMQRKAYLAALEIVTALRDCIAC